MSCDNISQQADEIEALRSIYEGHFSIEDEANRSYAIQVEEGSKEAMFQISAPWLKGTQRAEASSQLENVFLENIGEPVIYQWVEKLREVLQSFNDTESCNTEEDPIQETRENKSEHHSQFPLVHGEPLQAGKCTFQGHLAIVKSTDDVKEALQTLLEIKKVANATHNMYAYRIKKESGNISSDCDDDGETHAGSRMLHLLEILNVTNVLVVVTRWFGGVHLGPARFQHINNAARQVLTQAQMIVDEKKGSK
ncbi:Hypothetical predicted protein [Cloeon dipterum]|uniref:RWD domain-containing protein n=1 Tax=Cloeon dipterum TaxID=197152 RepID=A0A8S1CD68_9INSE|nr:Hypothetical predicted protein [Cloeon dipterum]